MSHIWFQEICDQHRGQSAQHWQWTQRPKGPDAGSAGRKSMISVMDSSIFRWWNQMISGSFVNHTYKKQHNDHKLGIVFVFDHKSPHLFEKSVMGIPRFHFKILVELVEMTRPEKPKRHLVFLSAGKLDVLVDHIWRIGSMVSCKYSLQSAHWLDLPVESGAFPVNPLLEVEGSSGKSGGYQNSKPFRCCTKNLHLISLGSMIYQWKLAMVYSEDGSEGNRFTFVRFFQRRTLANHGTLVLGFIPFWKHTANLLWRWFQCSTGRLGELQNLGLGTVGLQLPLAVREQLPLAVREPKLRQWALGMA